MEAEYIHSLFIQNTGQCKVHKVLCLNSIGVCAVILREQRIFFETSCGYNILYKCKKKNQSRYRLGVVHRFPES